MTAIREEAFKKLFPSEPLFRVRQMERAVFSLAHKGWEDVSTLPQGIRSILAEKKIPWVSYSRAKMESEPRQGVFKALLQLLDKKSIETVLMKNARDQWTICVSSQIGCAMGCSFCATGSVGFQRNLTVDEIVDQYRFWNLFLSGSEFAQKRISNIVFMGMGEPLLNYDTVKKSIQLFLDNTDVGSTRITVSTVGILDKLDDILRDKDWPRVRMAISLHSADGSLRREIMPSSVPDFLPKLSEWAKKFLKQRDEKRSYLTFEYVLLGGVNDTEHHAKLLARYVSNIGKVKINLIPYNFTHKKYSRSSDASTYAFQGLLLSKGITATLRKSFGGDISAACGQLVASH